MFPIILKYRLRQTYNTLTRSPRQKRLGWLISIAFIALYYMTLTPSMSHTYRGIYSSSGWQPMAERVSAHLAMVFFLERVDGKALDLLVGSGGKRGQRQSGIRRGFSG